jgi:hypothetical protein
MKHLFKLTNAALDIANYALAVNTVLTVPSMILLRGELEQKIAAWTNIPFFVEGYGQPACDWLGGLNWNNLSNDIEPTFKSLCKSGALGLLEDKFFGTHLSLAIPAALLFKNDNVEEIDWGFFLSPEFAISAIAIHLLDRCYEKTNIVADNPEL